MVNGAGLGRGGGGVGVLYGSDTLADIEAACERRAGSTPVVFRQTNLEGELVTWIQEAGDHACALVLNPAAYGHTSVALLDALRTVSIPVVECHLSNPAAREDFRQVSFVSPAASGVISGFGLASYELSVEAALRLAGLTPSNPQA